jgi:hypothetical protein
LLLSIVATCSACPAATITFTAFEWRHKVALSGATSVGRHWFVSNAPADAVALKQNVAANRLAKSSSSWRDERRHHVDGRLVWKETSSGSGSSSGVLFDFFSFFFFSSGSGLSIGRAKVDDSTPTPSILWELKQA